MPDHPSPPQRSSRRVLLAWWVALGLLPVLPQYQDGELSNLLPVLFGYLGLVTAPTRLSLAAVAVLLGHLGLSLLATLAVRSARRRLGPRRFRWAAVVGGVLALVGATRLVHACWPDRIFFDASNVSYDVSELVAGTAAQPAPYADVEALARHLSEVAAGRRRHELPCVIAAIPARSEVLAWGTWLEHAHFRRELDALRGE